MSSILGKPFKSFVKKQIEVRQESLGKYSNISSKDLQFYTTKAPFLRLASSVNLTDIDSSDSVLSKILKSSPNLTEEMLTGDALAKNFILQAGTINNTPFLKSGLSNGSPFDGAYGWGGIEGRGYVPMPGITQADVTYYNNGALSKTTINVRCYSKEQFQLLDALYLRPGYTLMLEFGHSQYLNNNNELVSFDSFYTPPMSEFLGNESIIFLLFL